jgi:hypothetical protein
MASQPSNGLFYAVPSVVDMLRRPQEQRVIVGTRDDSLWGVDGMLLVSSERESLGLFVVFWFLSMVVKGTRPEDEIRAQGERIYPMSVFVQRSDEFSLKSAKVSVRVQV